MANVVIRKGGQRKNSGIIRIVDENKFATHWDKRGYERVCTEDEYKASLEEDAKKKPASRTKAD